MKPNGELLESVFLGACFLYKKNALNKIRIYYETYF